MRGSLWLKNSVAASTLRLERPRLCFSDQGSGVPFTWADIRLW